jgi:hypothetical protein
VRNHPGIFHHPPGTLGFFFFDRGGI